MTEGTMNKTCDKYGQDECWCDPETEGVNPNCPTHGSGGDPVGQQAGEREAAVVRCYEDTSAHLNVGMALWRICSDGSGQWVHADGTQGTVEAGYWTGDNPLGNSPGYGWRKFPPSEWDAKVAAVKDRAA